MFSRCFFGGGGADESQSGTLTRATITEGT